MEENKYLVGKQIVANFTIPKTKDNGREQRNLIQKKKIEKIENNIDNKLKVQNKIRTKFVNMFEINKNKTKTKTHKKTISDINTDINQIFFSE